MNGISPFNKWLYFLNHMVETVSDLDLEVYKQKEEQDFHSRTVLEGPWL
jgi:hypothetical protein